MKALALAASLFALNLPVFSQRASFPLELELRAVVEPPDGNGGDEFGFSVAVSGKRMIVGAPGHDAAGTDVGAAYLFERGFGGEPGWRFVMKLLPTLSPGTSFGWSVAIDGDTAVVGMPSPGGSGFDPTYVYVYERDEGGADAWGLVHTDTGESLDNFRLGHSVAIEGDTIVAGAPQECDPFWCWPYDPELRVYEHDAVAGWSLSRKVAAFACSLFGVDVALLGDRVLVGSPGSRFYNCNRTGFTYGELQVLGRDQGGPDLWGMESSITPGSPARPITYFGGEVAYSRGRLAAPGSLFLSGSPNSLYQLLVVIHEEEPAGVWNEIATVLAPQTSSSSSYEYDLAFLKDHLLIAEPEAGAGRVRIHGKDEGGPNAWGLSETLVSPDAMEGEHFGTSLAIDRRTLAVGAKRAQREAGETGAVYVHELRHSDVLPLR